MIDSNKWLRNRSIRKLQSGSRVSSGQAMAEMAASLVIGIPIAVALVFLILDVVFMGTYLYKIQIAAEEAAKTIEGQKYWLGMPRPDFNQDQANNSAQLVADAVLNKLGLPASSGINVEESTVTGSNGVPVTLSKVTVTVNQLAVPGGYIPTFAMSAAGVSTTADTYVYRALQLSIDDPTGRPEWTTVVPVYDCGRWNGSNLPLANMPYGVPNANGPTQIAFLHSGAAGMFGVTSATYDTGSDHMTAQYPW
jgi:hypothetical protein